MFGTAARARHDGSMCKYAYRVCRAREFGERGGSAGKSIVPVSYSSVETSNSSVDKSSIDSNVWESNVRDTNYCALWYFELSGVTKNCSKYRALLP